MADSKGGKHSKGKGISKSNKSNTIEKKPEVYNSNSKLDLVQVSNNNPGPMDYKDKNPQPNINSSTTSSSIHTENELERLYMRFEILYTAAKVLLLTSGYSRAEAERAILNVGYIHGPKDLLDNILINSIAFIEKKFEPKWEAFKDMRELYKTMLEALVHFVMQTRKDLQRNEDLQHLSVTKWSLQSTTLTSHLQSGDENINSILVDGSYGSSSHNKNEDVGALNPSSTEKVLSESNIDFSLKKVGILQWTNCSPALVSHLRQNVPILTSVVRRKIGARIIKQQAVPTASGKLTEVSDIVNSDFLTSITGCSYECNSDDPKTGPVVDLVKSIRDLQEEVKEQKEWAQRKVIDSARRVSKDFLEFQMLRMAKVEKEKMENKKSHSEKSCMLKLLETEQSLRQVKFEASLMNNAVKKLEAENGQIRAETEAFRLNGLESDRNLKEVKKREKKCTKKLADVENLTSILRSQCEEEKHRVLQLEQELLQAEKEAEEAEQMKWRQEIKEKEHMFALLAEEIRKAEIQKAQSRAQLLKLRQKVEIDSQLARDNDQSLEAKLCRLRMSIQMPDTFLEDPNFWRDDFKAVSLESSAPCESSEKNRHWICMICLENEVSMVLLPCTHQVICFHCYEKSFKIDGAQCPCCQVRIEDSIRVYGLSS
ncbi:hypothetical protein DH2020_046987 [Rehmannia glutinosa]|uniref:RING-type domain-containing protein n=1 Tax=Rehmannia glutinosa TaxID=99300 RepID=A0ABR0UBB4_REHGL